MKNSPLKGPFQQAYYTPTTPTEIIFLERIPKSRDNVVTSPLYKCQGRIAIYRAGPRYVL